MLGEAAGTPLSPPGLIAAGNLACDGRQRELPFAEINKQVDGAGFAICYRGQRGKILQQDQVHGRQDRKPISPQQMGRF